MRQITHDQQIVAVDVLSKLPMRQITGPMHIIFYHSISKLPMRQITEVSGSVAFFFFSKLPMRQITVASRSFIRMTSCFIAIIPILPKIFKPGLKAAYFLVFWRTPKI